MTLSKTDIETLTWAPAWRIRELIARKEVSPVEVVDHVLHRIEQLEPKLHAFVRIDAEEARRQSIAAQQAVQNGAELGLLHGVPIAVLESEMVKGLSYGNLPPASYDSILVERLRKAGAIIVGATATYTFGDPRNRPRNPWDLTRDPGNSCRGSAVAVSAGMVPVAMAGDGAGSTRLPASWCGCIGLHTTRGLVPHVNYENPFVALNTSKGPIARDVRDCALVLQAIAGRDGRDIHSLQGDVPDYSAHLDDGIQGMRLAWTDDFGWSKAYWVEESAGIVAQVRAAAESLSAAGARVSPTKEAWPYPHEVMMALFFMLFPAYAEGSFGDPDQFNRNSEALDEVWGVGKETPPQILKPFPPDASKAEIYRLASEARGRMVDTLEEVLKDHDVLLSATTPLEPKPLGEWGLAGRGYVGTTYPAHTVMMNLIGYPAVSVPCGLRNGLPVGMQIIGRQGREDVVLRVAQAVGKAYPMPHPPSAI